MRRLFPGPPDDVDPVAEYLAAARPAPGSRPWVGLGMISSIDGATAVGGRSGALGGRADKEVFRAVRAVADVVLVAAGTVRAEGYGPVRLPAEVVEQRRARGRVGTPRLAIVSARLDLDPAAGCFDGPRPLVLTTSDADPSRVAALDQVAEVRRAGSGGRVDLAAAVASLRGDGDVVVCEGGPSLNAALAVEVGIDEVFLSVGPVLAGGSSHRILAPAPDLDARYELASLLTADDLLFCRYLRTPPAR